MDREKESTALRTEGALAGVRYSVREVPCSVRPIRYDASRCIGCNRCVQVCQCDILFPSPVKGGTPLVLYPGECYYCGACVMVCPKEGAIRLEHPLMNQARFIPAE